MVSSVQLLDIYTLLSVHLEKSNSLGKVFNLVSPCNEVILSLGNSQYFMSVKCFTNVQYALDHHTIPINYLFKELVIETRFGHFFIILFRWQMANRTFLKKTGIFFVEMKMHLPKPLTKPFSPKVWNFPCLVNFKVHLCFYAYSTRTPLA